MKPFLHQFVPKNILENLDLTTLHIESTSYITDELSEYYADLVWSCQSNNHRHKTEIAFLFEHKSYKPSHPHFQLIDYKRNSWKQKLAANQKPIPMIPIIFYHGQAKWVVESFDSYFGDVEPEILRFMPCFDYLLVNMQDYSDSLIKTFQSVLLQKALLSFKHHLDTNYLKTHIVEILFRETF